MLAPGIRIVSLGDEKIEHPPATTADRPHAPHSIELRRVAPSPARHRPDEDFAIAPANPQTPAEAHTRPGSGQQTPLDINELEASTPKDRHVAEIVPSFFYPAKNKWRVVCSCLTYFANGFNDGAPGALIPYIEKHYGIGYAVVSLIFVSNAAGFITTAFASDAIHAKLGRARTLMTSEAIMVVGYVMITCTPPFGAVIAAYFLLGLGYALNLALHNVFCANMANATVILGAGHGSYGIGGLVAPIIATLMVSHGVLWSRFFLTLIGLRVVIFFFTGFVHKGYEQEATSKFSASLERLAGRQNAESDKSTRGQLVKQVLKNRVTLLGAAFIFAYQGAEVSISGWIISFLIKARHGDPSKVGYVTSGFFGGIALGRLLLSYFASKVGIKLYVYLLVAGTVCLQLLTWLVPSIVGDAVTVSLEGFLLGPVYPCAQTLFSRLLPSRLQVSAIGFIASAGSSGGAIAPFLTGLLAQAVGPVVLHPICIALFIAMIGCWALLPAVERRDE
ncbi:MFS general substrate transporter [Myriangium duriaei CBS 260.36]|uniref:MFS general substrate transporter n=1 Tax=Myriangium duriaei CBS 260.36 TaxID=1168546 RepID=A0A9P4J1I5_9PEZI|nr:MFS general substrate transporter [Myriangium duriaei CBS 260.36]